VKSALIGLCLAMTCAPSVAQEIQLGPAAAPHKAHVELLSDAVEVKAGEPQVVELRFRVQDGFHINSHTPKDELLIPTALQLNAASGMKVVDEQYPKGSTFRLPLGEGATLDVYQGEFRVSVRLVAPKGSSTLTGLLKYQACDNAVCYPPKTLPVTVAVTGD
jgi:DsbC/DsbD-like thiol-disulfide interchange protein